MSNVVSITAKQPHISGEAVCINCRHGWMAVAPLGTDELECPECKTLRGTWLRLTFPTVPVLTCACDNSFMLVLDTGNIMCARCLAIMSPRVNHG